jgi:hypothetical protein
MNSCDKGLSSIGSRDERKKAKNRGCPKRNQSRSGRGYSSMRMSSSTKDSKCFKQIRPLKQGSKYMSSDSL